MDCNKTIDFMQGLKRMCAGVNYKCINCPIEYTEFCERLIYSYVADDFEPEIFQEEIIDKIQKWNDEHPQKTYADDFFEKFPNCPNCGAKMDGATDTNVGGKLTNLERIKAMSVEELAGFLESTSNDLAIKLFGSYISREKEYIQAWLESEVKDNDA